MLLHRRNVVQLTRCPHLLPVGRRHSNNAALGASASKSQRVTIPCKNNGFITLDIHRPSASASATAAPHQAREKQSILLYLPRSSLFQSRASDESLPSSLIGDGDVAPLLADASSTTVVQVNYRVSPDRRYPTAFHDVVVAYDWAVKHLSPKTSLSGGQGDEEPPGLGHRQFSQELLNEEKSQTRVGVCGELLGGTLALSLALSECRLPIPNSDNAIEHPGRVVAAAADSPIVDWILAPVKGTRAADSASGRKPSRRKQLSAASPSSSPSPAQEAASATPPAPTIPSLLAARKALFRPSRPADWFDPFASPLFFLRTPGMDVPTAQAVHSPAPTPSPASALDHDTSPIGDSTTRTPTHADSFLSAADLGSHSYAPLAADDTIEPPLSSQPDTDSSSTTPAATTPSSSTEALPLLRPRPLRRSPLKYPPVALLPAAFPAVHISVAAGSGVHEQAGEMVALLRRALGRFAFPETAVGRGAGGEEEDRWGEGGGSSASGGVAEGDKEREREEREAFVRDKVALRVREAGHAGWDRDEAERVGRWFGEVFRREA